MQHQTDVTLFDFTFQYRFVVYLNAIKGSNQTEYYCRLTNGQSD